MNDIYSFELHDLQGNRLPLEHFRDQVVLIVNTASRCGFTPQYHELEVLYQNYKGKGFSILACPCNQFAQQEPGTASEIQQFCTTHYSITFPISEKLRVNGNDAHPLFQYLKANAPGVLGTQAIKWNFTKFLIGRDGRIIERYGPLISPSALRDSIEQALST